MTDFNGGNSTMSWNFENSNNENNRQYLSTDWSVQDVDFEERNDGETMLWNFDNLDIDDGESFSTGWNFEDFDEQNTSDSIQLNSDDPVADDLSSASLDDDEIGEPPPKQKRLQDNEIDQEKEPFQLSEPLAEYQARSYVGQASDNDSQIGMLVDDGMQPGPSRQEATENSQSGIRANENTHQSYSNDNFEIDVKRVGFKRIKKFKFSDANYQVKLASKPGQSTVLLKDALDGLLHSIELVMEDLKSKLDGGYDRTLYIVSIGTKEPDFFCQTLTWQRM